MKDNPVYLYLDRDQCDHFGVSYFHDGVLVVAADTLLRSKLNGYDRFHTTVLKQFADDTITLTKTAKDRPGWYLLAGYNESDFSGLRNA